MSLANETTRFLTQSASGGGSPPDPHRGPSEGNGPERDPGPTDPAVPGGQPGGAAADRDPLGSATVGRDPPDSIVGRRVGAYLITRRIGSGGVGEVYKGVDVMLQREVAIKVLRDELTSDPIFLKRFSNEAKFLAKLSHPNVASVHAFLNEAGKQFMVMEYVAGISLDDFIRSGGPVPVERALNIFRKALDGIGHAHAHGIVHRDIKPANIMLADSGQVKVMDFGIARALDSQEQLTRHGQVAGTAKAMAPEQIRGAQADVRSDVYSLGIVLYTLLAGRPPFQGKGDHALMLAQLEQAPPPLHSLVDNIPPTLEATVMRALKKDPAARFQSVAAFAQAIDACLAERPPAPPPAAEGLDPQTASRTVINPVLQGVQRLPTSAAEDPPPQPPGRPRRTWPWLPAGAAALGVVALGLGTLLWPPNLKETVPQAPVPAETTPNPTVREPSPSPDPIAGSNPNPGLNPSPGSNPNPGPNPAVDLVKPRTLVIARLTSDGPAASIAGAGEPGAAASAALHRFTPGERIRLRITPSEDAHVYCYLQDETRRIIRFYPNRFNPSALVKANTPLEIPGAMRFELLANSLQVPETIACFASGGDVAGKLPASVFGDDFAELAATSLADVRQAFARATADGLAEGRFEIGFK